MDKIQKQISSIFTRYTILLLLGIGNLYIIYKILTPLTLHTTNAILSIFTRTILSGNTIILKATTIEIIPACVIGAAFYLLLILILSTPNIKFKTRIKAIALSTITLFILNITRIIFLIQILNSPSFETIHWIFWNIISVIFVVGIWFSTAKTFKIKSIPIYSDIISIKNLINPFSATKSNQNRPKGHKVSALKENRRFSHPKGRSPAPKASTTSMRTPSSIKPAKKSKRKSKNN